MRIFYKRFPSQRLQAYRRIEASFCTRYHLLKFEWNSFGVRFLENEAKFPASQGDYRNVPSSVSALIGEFSTPLIFRYRLFQPIQELHLGGELVIYVINLNFHLHHNIVEKEGITGQCDLFAHTYDLIVFCEIRDRRLGDSRKSPFSKGYLLYIFMSINFI